MKQILFPKNKGKGIFSEKMMLIWSSRQGDANYFILDTILVICLYVGASRLKSIDG